MKRIFIFIAFAAIFAACEPCQKGNTVVKKTVTHQKTSTSDEKSYDVYSLNVHANNVYFSNRFAVVEIDSCEYLVSLGNGYQGFMAHKGNCKYCAKRREEEIRKVLREEGVSNKLW